MDTTNYYRNEMLTERLAITSKAPYAGPVIVFYPDCTLLKGYPENKLAFAAYFVIIPL